MGFAVLLGYFFAWIYNYGKLHKEPKDKPLRLTETLNIPIEFAANAGQNNGAAKRLEQEKACYETNFATKDSIVEKLLALFRSSLEKEERNILSVCYWVFNGEDFTLRLSNSPYRISENLFVPKSDKYFSKKEFNCSGADKIPMDVFQSENQVVYSMAGVAISGDGKLRGYITIDSADENAFSDEIFSELRGFANLTEKMLRILDLNFKLNRENSLFNGILKDISDLFRSASKGNLIADISKILQDNFRFNRLMLITPDEQEKDRWHISEAAGEQKEIFKEISFNTHVKCLLYELLAGKVSVVKELDIPTDPYLCRFYENEPKNLELRSLFAVAPPAQNNSYPLIIVLESRNCKAVSIIDEIILTCIVACAALKLSEIQSKDEFKQKKKNDFTGIDSNGLGKLLNYYETEISDLKKNDDSLGILFFKGTAVKKENKIMNFEKFLEVLKNLKKAWNGQHLAMLGNDEFVLSVKGNFQEKTFKTIAMQMIMSAENMLAEYSLSIKSHSIWLNKNKIEDVERKLGQSGRTLFTLTVMKKFKEMSEVGE